MSENTALPLQFYDPNQLVREVVDLLRQRGLEPSFADGRQVPALSAAGGLLRALNIEVGVDAETHYRISTERLWDENQDVD